MQPELLTPVTSAAPLTRSTAAELKAVFRAGWSQPERVEGWVKSGLNSEFYDEECRDEWRAALERAVTTAPPGPVLDVGTGPGTLALLWAELGFATTGVDFSPAMLAMAHRLAGQRGVRATFLEGDAESLPFQEQQFSIVSSRFVIFTLPHPGYAVRRWAELLQPDGLLVLVGHDFHPHAEKPARPQPPPGAAPETRVGWQITEEYQKALDQLPFMDHKASHLQVVMEAAGLRDIVRLPLDDLLAARTRYAERHEATRMQATPYILVGRK